MSKYWKVSSPGHELSYFAYAPDRAQAIKALDIVLAGHNPARLAVQEITRDAIDEDEGVFFLDDNAPPELE